MKILVVDDSKTARYMLISAMRELGYSEFYACENIEEARKTLEAEMIELIFCDWHMPGGTGLDLLRFVRGNTSFGKIPFIMVTTEQHKENILEALKVGIQGYLFKPIKKDALKTKIYDLIKTHAIQTPTP
jgi:two-component system, chemotaxis family, chemotaxis protein CheY